MLLSVLICFYGKKNKRVRVFTLCTLFFSAVSYKKENRQRFYNLLSIFILKLIIYFSQVVFQRIKGIKKYLRMLNGEGGI